MAPPTKPNPMLSGGFLNPGGARPPGGAGAAAQAAANLALQRTIQRFRLPQRIKLRITLFRTDVSKFPDAQDFVAEHIAAARAALDAHNIELSPFPENGVPIPLKFNEGVIDHKQVGQIRAECNNTITRPGFPVIYCPFHDNYREVKGGGDLVLGEKYGGPGRPVDGVNWLSFAIINVRKKSKSGMTLLHEMGHGAGLSHFEGDRDVANFMYLTDTDGPGERQMILLDQVMAFAECYFAEPRVALTPDIKKLWRPSSTSKELFAGRW